MMEEDLLHALKEHLFYTPGATEGQHKTVYGVFDAARYDGFWLELDLWKLPYACLYRGDCDKIASVAPYLIALDIGKDPAAVDALLSLYGQKGCVFLESSHDWQTVLFALQDLFHIRLPDNTPALLRFYDPRMLNDIFTALGSEGRDQFFTAVRTWWVEDKSPNCLMTYYKDPEKGVQYHNTVLVFETPDTASQPIENETP
jgi:hypothetical protein